MSRPTVAGDEFLLFPHLRVSLRTFALNAFNARHRPADFFEVCNTSYGDRVLQQHEWEKECIA
jgi:hypothetical protein